jgi:hypothetical protein
MSADSIPWPKKHDQLFKGAGQTMSVACLNFVADHLGFYANGYKRAAELLAEHAKQAIGEIDVLVYPIISLYRQYLELRLKEIIRDGSELIGEPREYPTTHNLSQLWRLSREIMEKVYTGDPTEPLDAAGNIIAQFSQKDPASTAFRYPIDRNGKKSLPDLTHLDLTNFSDVMEGLSSLLEGVICGIGEYLDDKRTMDYETRAEWGE